MFKIPQPFKGIKKFFNAPVESKRIELTHSTDHVGKPRRIKRSQADRKAQKYAKRLQRFSNTSYRKAPAIDKAYRHKQSKEVNHGHHPVIGLTLAPR